MPFRKYTADSNRKVGTIKVALAVSPKLSLSDPSAELSVLVKVNFDSKAYKDHSITICTDQSIFDVHSEKDGGIDMFARGAFDLLKSTSGDASKNISLGFLRVNERDASDATDLRERGCRFTTIPGDGSPVTFEHRLSWTRILKHEGKRSREDVVPGECFELRINHQYFGTRWWCWGDLERDLKEKKFHNWRPPYDSKPDDEFLRKGNWVLGEEPMTLGWEDTTDGGTATFEVIA